MHQISVTRLVRANSSDSPANWLLSLPKSEPVWWPHVKRFGHCLPTRAWSPFQFPSLAMLLVKPAKTPLLLAQTRLSKLNLDILPRLHRPSSFKRDCYPSQQSGMLHHSDVLNSNRLKPSSPERDFRCGNTSRGNFFIFTLKILFSGSSCLLVWLSNSIAIRGERQTLRKMQPKH